MSQFTTNQVELLIFRSPVISDAGIQRSGAYSDWQRSRYVLLLADQRLSLSAVVIQRTVVEMLSVFLFSETFSK